MKKSERIAVLKKTAGEVRDMLRQVNPYSRWIVRIGSLIVFTVYTAALLVRVCAGRYIDYYTAVNLCGELLACGKECVGAVYVPAMLLEIFDIAGGKQKK